jgi:hypothetical protein
MGEGRAYRHGWDGVYRREAQRWVLSYVLLGKMLLMNFLRAFSPDADGSFSIASHGERWVDG